MRIRFSTGFPYMPVARQLPGGGRRWGDHEFVLDDDSDANSGRFDGWVVFNDVTDTLSIDCPKERTILLLGEPPSRVDLKPGYAAQFGTVIACEGVANARHSQPCLPWWVGLQKSGATEFHAVLTYDDLCRMRHIQKTRRLSIVCSSLDVTAYHRQRLKFVKRLVEHFGSRIDVFGSAYRPIEDKWHAIAPYRYHVAIENSARDHYWTEKLADAFLGGALPIYCGAPNIDEYFAPESLVSIDILRPGDALRTIEAVLEADPYETAMPAIWAARDAVLNRYNVFPAMADVLAGLPASQLRRTTIRPSAAFAMDMAGRARRARFLVGELFGRAGFRLAGSLGRMRQ